MNKYLIIFIIIHLVIIGSLFTNIFLSNRRMKRLKNDITLKDGTWVRACMRARHHFVQSIISFAITFFGELLSFWLLWMAGTFDYLK